MLPLTHAALASFSATTAAATAVFSPTGRSACVRKLVAPSRYRHEPYGARVIPISCVSSLGFSTPTPITFTPYPSVSTIRCKQNAITPALTEASGTFPSTVSTCSSSSVSTSGCSTGNSLSLSSNCSKMSDTIFDFLPAAEPVAPREQPQKKTKSVKQLVESRVAPPPTSPFTSRFAVIKFKHETATFVAPFKISSGDIVVVEGDRGENIGTVAEIQKDAPAFAVAAKVLRRATEKDLSALKVQREREAAATLSTRAVAESLGLHGRVEDAEYQFDLNKLTIFVSRPAKTTFVDFRKLQRTLFREFRCRIWCSYMDEVEAAEAGPRTR